MAFAALPTSGCDADPPVDRGTVQGSQDTFWSELTRLCGRAHAGRVAVAPAGDTVLSGKPLVMHVRECGPTVIRVPFHVGEDRSRTWVFTRTDSSLILTHEHRPQIGSDVHPAGYGGVTTTPGSATFQTFPADARTVARNPRTRTNVWSIALDRSRFTYGMDRRGTDRHFRIEFDLTDTVPTPPPPWGR